MSDDFQSRIDNAKQAVANESQINALTLKALQEEARPKPEEMTPPDASKALEPRVDQRADAEIQRAQIVPRSDSTAPAFDKHPFGTLTAGPYRIDYQSAPFLSNSPAMLTSGLACVSIGRLNSSFGASVNRVLGSTMLAGMGAGQALIDGRELLNSNSGLTGAKYGLSLGGDLGIVAGGVLNATRFGPKWLGPAVLIGSIAGRALIDVIPDKISKH